MIDHFLKIFLAVTGEFYLNRYKGTSQLFIASLQIILKLNVEKLVLKRREVFLYLTKIFQLLLPFFHNKFTEAGVDEAGRGCYAGPVFAAAVILPSDFYHPFLNDSKMLSREQRDTLRPLIEKESIAYAVSSVCNEEIDRINILQASFKAMHLALNKLKSKPDILLIDGNRFKPYKKMPHHCIIKGDGMYASIAAASVLAKTYRDQYMENLHKKHKVYSWHTNKGYGTPEHRSAIKEHGLCRYHRMSFNIYAEHPRNLASMQQSEVAESNKLAD